MNAVDVVAEFLRDHPEYASGVIEHPQLGPVMSTDATHAFVEWSVAKAVSGMRREDGT